MQNVIQEKNAHIELSVLNLSVRNCSIILLCFFSSLTGFSQDKISNVSFGIKTGMGMSNIRPSSYTDTSGDTYHFKTKTSVAGGLRLFVPIGKNIVFLPEMVLIIKGARESYNNTNYDYSYVSPVNLFYIEIPLNINYRIPTRSGQFLIGGGPMPAMKFLDTDGPMSTQVKSFDMGLNLISCYQFPIGFSVEVNYNLGLMNVSNRPERTLKNSGFCISVGYAF
ncbi:MAG: outer membrane beta-barrel protein [Lacibacter sp.]